MFREVEFGGDPVHCTTFNFYHCVHAPFCILKSRKMKVLRERVFGFFQI